MTSMPFTLRLLTIGSLVALVACAREPQAARPQYEAVADVRQTMELIIDPAADLVWDSAGTVITDTGEQDLAPATPEAWAGVEAAAAVLAESGNLLLMPGRSAGPGWDLHARDLISAGKLAMTAARQQDADALFDAGGRIYEVCLACHEQYPADDGAE
jgi:hypothetical protein